MTPPRDTDSYPHDLVGGEAPPPTTPPDDLIAAWRAYEAEQVGGLDDALVYSAGGNWRSAAALEVLLEEANAANPRRDRRSDGGIGDARHRALGSGSDHNPWVIHDGVGVFRARDFDTDGLDLAGAFERMRAAAAAGKLPQLIGGGYLIFAGRITDPGFRFWREYLGDNPHVSHGHVSVSRDPRRFDDRRPWGCWTPPRPAKPRTRPAPARPASTPPPTRPPGRGDLTGRGPDVRGERGDRGPRVRALQRFLGRHYPRYARSLTADGIYGPATAQALATFARASGIPDADGANIGPRIARALYRAGFRG